MGRGEISSPGGSKSVLRVIGGFEPIAPKIDSCVAQ